MTRIMISVTPAQHEALKRVARAKGGLSISALVRVTLVECLKLPTNGNHSDDMVELPPIP